MNLLILRLLLGLLLEFVPDLPGVWKTTPHGLTLPDPGYLDHPPQYFAPSTTPLAVANLRKEPVKLFKVTEAGLEFVQEIPVGEAVDVDVKPGDKLAATISDAPHCANFAVKGMKDEAWLLRAPTVKTTAGECPRGVVPVVPIDKASPSSLPPLPEDIPTPPKIGDTKSDGYREMPESGNWSWAGQPLWKMPFDLDLAFTRLAEESQLCRGYRFTEKHDDPWSIKEPLAPRPVAGRRLAALPILPWEHHLLRILPIDIDAAFHEAFVRASKEDVERLILDGFAR